MHLDLLHHRPPRATALHRTAPAVKLSVFAAFVLALLLIPRSNWPLYLLSGLVLIAAHLAAELRLAELFSRLVKVAPAVAIFALALPASHGFTSGWDRMAETMLKAMLAIASSLLLVATTPPADLCAGMRRLGVPRLVVAIFALMVRYMTVLGDEWQRMRRARMSRSFRSSRLADWQVLPHLVGMVLIRALDRGERIHQAMLARNWTGEFLSLTDNKDKACTRDA